ncbi:MAG: M23 family peptidase, partial [Tsuneonella sp.]
MFKSREQDLIGHAPVDGMPGWRAAALTHAQIAPAEPPAAVRTTDGLSETWEHWRSELSKRIAALDLAPDLAEQIGSRRWFRGLGTLIGLSGAALAFWPGFAPLEAAPATRVNDSVRDEFRSQMIMPLALGGDSGRHMGATDAVRPLAAAPER